MAYINSYYQTAQPTYPNYQQTVLPQVTPFLLDTVQGEAGAKVYQVLAGQEVILFDLDAPFVYRKKRGMDNRLEIDEKYSLSKVENTPIPVPEPVVPQIDMTELNASIQEMVDIAVQERFAAMMGTQDTAKKKGGK